MSVRADQVRAPGRVQRRPKRRSRLWLVPTAGLAGALAAWLIAFAMMPDPPRTVSEVRAEIADLVLRKSALPNASDGGSIGPWWVAAASGDPSRGEFSDFQLTSGSMRVAAKNARLVIDPYRGTFSFELSDVVLMRLPEDGAEESGVVHLERYTLGPAPLRGRVVHDEPALSIGIVRRPFDDD